MTMPAERDFSTDRIVPGANMPYVDVPAGEEILYLDGVTVSFDGFRALNELSLIVQADALRAMIGPNGAGKTTMMDVITGKTKPDLGEVKFRGDINLLDFDEAAIAQLGIGRKFQKPSVFEGHSVYENLELAMAGSRRVMHNLFARLSGEQRDKIDAQLESVGLLDQRHGNAGALSHGQKQWLEISMLLMQEPELLMLDEPVAGMTDSETERTAELLHEIARNHAVIVVEHDMEFVRALDCRVTVLHEGAVIAEGDMDAVQNNERVIEVYLGR